jgi:hypothetical protein
MTHVLGKSLTIIRLIACGAIAVLLPSMAQAQGLDPEWAAYCDTYTSAAVDQAKQAEEWQCSRFEGYWDPPRWTTDRKVHLPWCLGQDPEARQPQSEDAARLAGLFHCQNMIAAEAMAAGGVVEDPGAAGDILTQVIIPDPATAGNPTGTSVDDGVEVYDRPGGNTIGELTRGEVVELIGACPDNNNYCHILRQAAPKDGWVYQGPDYQSLTL